MYVCVFRLIKNGHVPITVVHVVDDIFAVGLKNRSDILCDGLNRQIPVKNLSELK